MKPSNLQSVRLYLQSVRLFVWDVYLQIGLGVIWIPLSLLTFIYDLAVHEWPERTKARKTK